MTAGTYHVPPPRNETVLGYAPSSPERAALASAVLRRSNQIIDIPCVVGGRHVYTGRVWELTNPSEHRQVLARVHLATPEVVTAAIDAAREARAEWSRLRWEDRVAVFLRAAALLAGPHRQAMNAATLLGQGKTPHQAEIDAVCELIDFWRFNAAYTQQILAEQPPISADGTWNRTDWRPLDGFVFAIGPFNFTSIAVNLPTAPAFLGNTALWKPSLTSSLGAWEGMLVLEAAGLPPGVVNLLNGHGADVGDLALASPELAGVHFTGSTPTFQAIWRTVGERLPSYRQYPRLVGETGGKDFILAHPSSDPAAVATAIVRGAYEYQGQKCSAASRLYLPRSRWSEICDRVVSDLTAVRMGDVRDFSCFVGPVIDQRAFEKHSAWLEHARATAEIVAGGTADGSHGWFVAPTLVRVDDPAHRMMSEEIFGPIATAFVYDDEAWDETLALVDRTSPYALTGALFAEDRRVIASASEALRFAAGNFYINDKPTGAVVGQQPFGGGRASGTNDKAGAPGNLLRWANPRTIKETFVPPTDWRYPFLG